MKDPIVKCSTKYAAYEITMPDGSEYLVAYWAWDNLLEAAAGQPPL